jgi:hypothetical protein
MGRIFEKSATKKESEVCFQQGLREVNEEIDLSWIDGVTGIIMESSEICTMCVINCI